MKTIYSEEASFGTIEVAESIEGTRQLRLCRRLLVNGALESALFCDEAFRELLLFPYMDYFDYAASLRPQPGQALLLGGGALAYAWHFLAVFPEKSLTVVERFPEIIRVARQFFWLDELEEKYKGRLRIVTGDGFALLERGTKQDAMGAKTNTDEMNYDADPGTDEIIDGTVPGTDQTICISDPDSCEMLNNVNQGTDQMTHMTATGRHKYHLVFNDAFIGEKRIGRSDDQTRLVKDNLTAGGIYAVNMTAALRGLWSFHGKWFTRSLRHNFRYVDTYVCEKDRDPYESQNLMVMGSDEELG